MLIRTVAINRKSMQANILTAYNLFIFINVNEKFVTTYIAPTS
jgi:hypothetical protein